MRALPSRISPLMILLLAFAAAGPARAQVAKQNEAPPPPPQVQGLDDDEGDGRAPPATREVDMKRPDATPSHRAPPRGKAHTHDGLMLRAQIGPGYGVATLRSAPALKVRGLGVAMSLDVGYALTETLTLHARYGLASVFAGEAQLGPDEVETGEQPTATASMIAVAGSYFVMPLNAFVTLSVGLGVTSMEVSPTFRDTDTRMGWAFALDLGKEWWLSENTALGFAVRGWFSAMASESDANVFFPAAALLLSGSYQ